MFAQIVTLCLFAFTNERLLKGTNKAFFLSGRGGNSFKIHMLIVNIPICFLPRCFIKTLYKYAHICFSPVNFLDVNKSHLAWGSRINKTLNLRALYNNS